MGIEINGVCYYYVSVSNGLFWEDFEAACLPGHEDDLEVAENMFATGFCEQIIAGEI